MTTTPKSKDELVLENALLIQRNAINEDFKKLLKEELSPVTAVQDTQQTEINSIKERLDGIWLKIWAIVGTGTSIGACIGFLAARAIK